MPKLRNRSLKNRSLILKKNKAAAKGKAEATQQKKALDHVIENIDRNFQDKDSEAAAKQVIDLTEEKEPPQAMVDLTKPRFEKT